MRTGEFYLTDDILLSGRIAKEVILEIAEKDFKKPDSRKRVINFGNLQTHQVETDSFGDDRGIIFLARGKKLANQYGLTLRKKEGINKVTFYLPKIQDRDYARGFWLSRVSGGSRSVFGGDYGYLANSYGSVLRVSGEESAEGALQKISPREAKIFPYDQRQLDSFLKTAKGIKEGRLGSSQAGKLEELILGLKQFLNTKTINF